MPTHLQLGCWRTQGSLNWLQLEITVITNLRRAPTAIHKSECIFHIHSFLGARPFFSWLLFCSEISKTFSLSLLSTDDFVFYFTVIDLPSSIAVMSTVLRALVLMQPRFPELPVFPHNAIPSICPSNLPHS